MNDIRQRLTDAFTTVANIAIEQVSQAVERGVKAIEDAVQTLEEQTRGATNKSESDSETTQAAKTTAPRSRKTKAGRTSNHRGPRQLPVEKIRQIQDLAAQGKTIKEIADEVQVSVSSVQRYRASTRSR